MNDNQIDYEDIDDDNLYLDYESYIQLRDDSI